MATLLQRLHRFCELNGLWRDGDFLRLWSSLSITYFGGQVTFLALPLTAALLLHATPLEMGILAALEALPFPLFGLFTGVLVDRLPKLPIIIWSDIGRGVALLAVPVCAWLGVLSLGVLYTVGFLVGLGSALGWPAYQVLMTERVGRANLVEANAKIGVSDATAQLVGPGIAGGLIQWLTAPFAILLDALSFFVSAWILRGIRPRPSDAAKLRKTTIGAAIGEGLAEIWRNAILRSLAWAIALWQIFRHATMAIAVLFAARELGFSAGAIGAVWMLAGVGSLGAAAVIDRLNGCFGFGPTMLGGLLGTGCAWLVLATATGSKATASLVFGAGLFVLDFSVMVFFINYLTLRHAVTPDELLGRVTATMICITTVTAPLGALLGGWVAEHAGLRTTMFGAGIGGIMLVALIAWASPVLDLRRLPQPRKPHLTESVADELAG